MEGLKTVMFIVGSKTEKVWYYMSREFFLVFLFQINVLSDKKRQRGCIFKTLIKIWQNKKKRVYEICYSTKIQAKKVLDELNKIEIDFK